MFEVGKKYINKCTGSIVECLYLGQKRAFVRTSDGNEYNTPLWNDYYTEYKEPVKHVRYVAWFSAAKHAPYNEITAIMYSDETSMRQGIEWLSSIGRKYLKTETIEYIEE